MTELSTTHWDCECETRYIHPNFHKFCPACGAKRIERPGARQDEVADLDKHWRLREEPPHETTESTMERLAEYTRILREVLANNLQAWEGEEGGVREEHAELIEETRTALEATKEV